MRQQGNTRNRSGFSQFGISLTGFVMAASLAISAGPAAGQPIFLGDDLTSNRFNALPNETLQIVTFYDGAPASTTLSIEVRHKTSGATTFITVGPLNTFSARIDTFEYDLNGFEPSCVFEVNGVVPNGVIDGVAFGLFWKDMAGNYHIIKSNRTGVGGAHFIGGWPVGMNDNLFAARTPQITDSRAREMARATILGAAMLPDGSHTCSCFCGGDLDGCCPGEPAPDLDLILNTGWDQAMGVTTTAGNPDDDWQVTLDANGGVTPRPADVVQRSGGWSLPQPDSMWLSAVVDPADPSMPARPPRGLYEYTYCFCLAPDFIEPSLTLSLRADDRVQGITLNGSNLLSGPGGGFNGPPLEIEESRPRFFQAGENCLTVQVRDTHRVITGLNLVGRVSATEGFCCPGRR